MLTFTSFRFAANVLANIKLARQYCPPQFRHDRLLACLLARFEGRRQVQLNLQ
jgi:hypothetical protein